MENILKVLSIVYTNNYETKLFEAALGVAFFGYFKLGEITEGKNNIKQTNFPTILSPALKN